MTESSDWSELRALYGTAPVPDLDSCDFFHVHVDERGASVTFGFETQQLPPHPKPEWSEKAYNTLCFWIEFTGVTDLRLSGIHAEAERAVQITGGDTPDGLRVSVNSDTRSITFAASSSQVSHTRVYLQGAL
ncbi:immunity 50 family protein [Streptomyces sp. APSN-46.1]|uniref:Imm50 family immunity protein n=1 Tax=Streptomyces sp. APSN-46.1 TaxID=2929049 RepID=UPI001FB35423|nr:Imm50 family immunity protein [Streptomyces sp. APSN-46.1]MCJ1678941.1 immunity 50 family protein [Streptomyces sp. APSN-46.1]